ncbi:hypothetical protein Bca52824_031311 [Brassica carinata]|uniref:Uncharacterized protein n=1 Tax=Brassica carinata TaxID=52824 RepID=A0A8X7S9X4_BRACI|nr:hypothetical protein Bca52824_031311 [Brassica carinata]
MSLPYAGELVLWLSFGQGLTSETVSGGVGVEVIQRSLFVYCGFRLRRAVYDLSFISLAFTLSFAIPASWSLHQFLVLVRGGVLGALASLRCSRSLQEIRVSRLVITTSSSDQWVSGGGLFSCLSKTYGPFGNAIRGRA